MKSVTAENGVQARGAKASSSKANGSKAVKNGSHATVAKAAASRSANGAEGAKARRAANVLLNTLIAFKRGNFSVRMPVDRTDLEGKVADALNDVLEINQKMVSEFERISRAVGKDGKPALNKFSSTLTRGMVDHRNTKDEGSQLAEHDYPGAKAMLFAAGVPDDDAMANLPHVGVASVWWEGNPCK